MDTTHCPVDPVDGEFEYADPWKSASRVCLEDMGFLPILLVLFSGCIMINDGCLELTIRSLRFTLVIRCSLERLDITRKNQKRTIWMLYLCSC